MCETALHPIQENRGCRHLFGFTPGVTESRDEPCWNWKLFELEIVKQQPNRVRQHFYGLGIAKGVAMQASGISDVSAYFCLPPESYRFC